MIEITPEEYRKRKWNKTRAFKVTRGGIKFNARLVTRPGRDSLPPGYVSVQVDAEFVRLLKLNGRTVRARLGAGALD
ncbi:MAG: hypothetical protein AAB909_02750 [Patescibacteria group bacterium]